MPESLCNSFKSCKTMSRSGYLTPIYCIFSSCRKLLSSHGKCGIQNALIDAKLMQMFNAKSHLTDPLLSHLYRVQLESFCIEITASSYRSIVTLSRLQSHLSSSCFLIVLTSLWSVFFTGWNQLPKEWKVFLPFLQDSRAFATTSFYLHQIIIKN